MRQIALIALIAILILSSSAGALRAFSGFNVNVDTPVHDDLFASGSVISINAPVESATLAGGNIIVNAPVARDLIVAGGQVTVNSQIGGKIIAFGGNLNIGGNISKNALLAGGQVDIRPGTIIGKDAFISGGTANNAGNIKGNLTVSATRFDNTGNASRTEFYQIRTEHEEPEFPIFSLLMTIGYLLAGLILLRLFPAAFSIIDQEIKTSTAVKTIAGFVLLIAGWILVLLVLITVIGIPTAVIMSLLLIVAIMVAGLFVSFSLGKLIFDLLKFKTGETVIFVVGFLILNGLFFVPYAGGAIKIIAISLGFGSIIYSAKTNWSALSRPA